MSNENLAKEHINFIAGVRNSTNTISSAKSSKGGRLRSCRLGAGGGSGSDLSEIAATASSVINLKKARQRLRNSHRLFDTLGTGGGQDQEKGSSDHSKLVGSSQTTGGISTIDGVSGGSGDLPKIKMLSSHHQHTSSAFMSAHDEELLSSIATATSCSHKKLKSTLRMPLNIRHDEQQQSPLPPLPPPAPLTTTKNTHLADNSSLTNLTIETNDLSLANEMGVGVIRGRTGSYVSGKPTPPPPSLSTPVFGGTTGGSEQQLANNSIHNNQLAAQSPNFIRDRYYQILREQVFPFLQKPSNNLNINQSPKEVQTYCNDVLY